MAECSSSRLHLKQRHRLEQNHPRNRQTLVQKIQPFRRRNLLYRKQSLGDVKGEINIMILNL